MTVTDKSPYVQIGTPLSGVDLGNGSDTSLLTTYGAPCVGFRVGTTAGAVKVTDLLGNTFTIPAVQVGETVKLMCTKIWLTGTAAVGITGFFMQRGDL